MKTLHYPTMMELPGFLCLPSVIDASPAGSTGYLKGRFRIVEYSGYRLLLKMENSFYSYRDWVASRLFQHMGINAQSSILLKLTNKWRSRNGQDAKQNYQAGIVFVEQHAQQACRGGCDYDRLVNALDRGDLRKVAQTSFKDTEVLLMKSLLPHFFSANEPSDVLIGNDHRFYLIDNSQMFSCLPTKASICGWFDASPLIGR